MAENTKIEWTDHTFNPWIGATIVNQVEADRDIPKLLAVPARVRFLSMEPLLGPVDMRECTGGLPCWVIVGAETGNRADKVVPERAWVDHITDFCAENEIPVFYKDNLRAYYPDLPASAFPWEVEK